MAREVVYRISVSVMDALDPHEVLKAVTEAQSNYSWEQVKRYGEVVHYTNGIKIDIAIHRNLTMAFRAERA